MAKEPKNKKDKKHFFKDFKAELKKVIWPTPKQVANNTVAVITIVIITAIVVLCLDLAFDAMNNYGINKLKQIVGTETSDEENTIDDSDNIDDDGNIVSEGELTDETDLNTDTDVEENTDNNENQEDINDVSNAE